MQNKQNAAEIQQRVINLVELYRTKVGKESTIAKDAKAVNDFWVQQSVDMMMENGQVFGGMYGEGPHTEDWIKHLMVNEQLLGHFYSVVAGEKAEKEILDQLLPDVYDKNTFSEEEESFLTAHFKEMVNYIILTPCDDSLDRVNRSDGKNAYTIPSEVLELIKARVEIPAGSRIYYPNTAFAQLANLFSGCTYYCDTMFYAWTRVAIYANGIVTDTFDYDTIPSSCDVVMSYIAKVSYDSKSLTKILEAYKNMSIGGKLVLLCPSDLLWKKDTDKAYCPQADLRNQLVQDKSIVEIIQLPSVMSPNLDTHNWCLLIAEKGHAAKSANLIDARFAFMDTKYSFSMEDMKGMGENIVGRFFSGTESGRFVMNSSFGTALDTNALNAMIDNKGFLGKEGLRKMVCVDKAQLDADNLSPQIYVVERPTPDLETIPLNSICQLANRQVKSLDFDLPLDTPWIKEHNLSRIFQGALDMETIEIADCPNIPPHDSDYEFDNDGKFVEDSFHYLIGGKPKSMQVAQYRASTYLDGNTNAVIFKQDKDDIKTALFLSSGHPVVVEGSFFRDKRIMVFYPCRGVDVLKLLAVLKMPVVYRQIQAYEEFGLNNHLKDILIPWNELVINDEKKRLLTEEDSFKTQENKFNEMKTEYINEVRMRKHDMRPHMKQLKSAKNLMQHYIDNLNTEENVREHLCRQLTRFQVALTHLSDIIEHLSDEEQFGESERFCLTDYFEKLITESSGNFFDIVFNVDSKAVERYLQHKLYAFRDHIIASAKDPNNKMREYSFSTHWSYAIIAPLDFDRMVQNILENARKHGFTDQSRTDYVIWITLSVDPRKDMYIIDFMNNGTPLPDGMTKARYGLKGEKAGLTGGTGYGGYIVKKIVSHYGGDLDVFCKDGITTVRILLPIATI